MDSNSSSKSSTRLFQSEIAQKGVFPCDNPRSLLGMKQGPLGQLRRKHKSFKALWIWVLIFFFIHENKESLRQDRITGHAVTLGGNRSRHHGEGVGGRKGWQQACVRGRGAFILGCGPEARIGLGLGLDHRERGAAQVQNPFLLGEGRGGSQR